MLWCSCVWQTSVASLDLCMKMPCYIASCFRFQRFDSHSTQSSYRTCSTPNSPQSSPSSTASAPRYAPQTRPVAWGSISLSVFFYRANQSKLSNYWVYNFTYVFKMRTQCLFIYIMQILKRTDNAKKKVIDLINLQTFYKKITYEMDKNLTVLAKCEFYFFQMLNLL